MIFASLELITGEGWIGPQTTLPSNPCPHSFFIIPRSATVLHVTWDVILSSVELMRCTRNYLLSFIFIQAIQSELW